MVDDVQKQLIAAVNLLCEYVEQHLVPGWTIAIEMNHEEASLSLFDPGGEEHEVPASDWCESSITTACDTARDMENNGEAVE
jgi:hypothetical protein